MKFVYTIVALLAAGAQSQPVLERDFSPAVPTLAERGESAISGTVDTQLNEPKLLERSEDVDGLQKRQNADFSIRTFTNNNCAGNGILYSGSGDGKKGDFAGTQYSVRADFIRSGFHVSLYRDAQQQPSGQPNLRLNEGNVGQCWLEPTAGWKSYGFYSGA